MPYVHPDVLDNGLGEIEANADAIHLCSSIPSSYAAALAASLGNKASPTISGPANRTGGNSGRMITVEAVTDGAVTATGTGHCVALLDTVTSRLLVAKELLEPTDVTSGGTLKLVEWTIAAPSFEGA